MPQSSHNATGFLLSMDSRPEIESLVQEVQELVSKFENNQSSNEYLSSLDGSIAEAEKAADGCLADIKRVKAQYEEGLEQLEKRIEISKQAGLQFEAELRQQQLRAQQELEKELDNSLDEQIIQTLETLAKQKESLEKYTKEYASLDLNADDIVQLKAYRSLGLSLEKVKSQNPQQIWDALSLIWLE